jgi:hypothetical protein
MTIRGANYVSNINTKLWDNFLNVGSSLLSEVLKRFNSRFGSKCYGCPPPTPQNILAPLINVFTAAV